MAEPAAIDRLLRLARARLDRVRPEDLADEVAAGAVIVDIRPEAQRTRDGDVPGAVVIDRNVLEWRLDPTCPHRDRRLAGGGCQVILICDEGYQSSLAAANLNRLGVDATDVDGGFQAWREAELPVTGCR